MKHRYFLCFFVLNLETFLFPSRDGSWQLDDVPTSLEFDGPPAVLSALWFLTVCCKTLLSRSLESLAKVGSTDGLAPTSSSLGGLLSSMLKEVPVAKK